MAISEETEQTADKKKVMPWLKKCNVRLLAVSVVLLMILCTMLLVRIRGLNNRVADLAAQVEGQRAQLEQLAEELAARGEPDANKGNQTGNGLAIGEQTGNNGEGGEGGQSVNNGQGGEDGQSVNNGQTIEDGQGGNNGQNGDGVIEAGFPEVTAAHKVYLTFDDGPGNNTQEILDILAEYDIKATFFVVGKESNSVKESLKRIVEDGHTLGMHSWSHKYSEVYASMESFSEDFTKLQDYLYEVTGVKSVYYRFPGGSSNTISEIDMSEFAEYLDSQGVRFFDWNVAAGDGSSVKLSAETILKNCTDSIGRYGTSVILMHEKDTTVEALPKIIETIQAMEDTVILPITEDTKLVQHIKWREEEEPGEE